MSKQSSRIAVFLILIAAAHASAEPLPYGKAIASDTAPRTSITDYQAHIAELEGEHGRDGFALAEHWLDLGLAQRNASDHGGAVDSFSNALQIRRTHLGLHDPGQIPIIDLLIESHRAQGNWEQVDAHFKLLASVHPPESRDMAEQLVEIWMRYARWKREAHRLPTSQPPYDHLVLGWEATEHALVVAASAYGERDQRLVEMLNLRAALAYDMVRYVSTGASDGMVNRTPQRINTSLELATSEFIERQNDAAISSRNHFIHSFIDGRVALEEAMEIQRSAGDVRGEAHAAALLGDWHFLFSRPQTAAKRYAEAQRLLRADGAEPASALFLQPRALPEFTPAADTTTKLMPLDNMGNYALARFDVDSKGRARNIKIVKTRPASSKDIARKARKHVAATLFRPRIDNGKPVRTPDVEVRYVLPDAGGARRAPGKDASPGS